MTALLQAAPQADQNQRQAKASRLSSPAARGTGTQLLHPHPCTSRSYCFCDGLSLPAPPCRGSSDVPRGWLHTLDLPASDPSDPQPFGPCAAWPIPARSAKRTRARMRAARWGANPFFWLSRSVHLWSRRALAANPRVRAVRAILPRAR